MLFNIFFGFIIPWILAIIFIGKDKRAVMFAIPVGSSIALLINRLGFQLNFWKLKPFELDSLSSLPVDLGIYPVLVAFFTHFFRKNKYSSFLLIFMFSFIATSIEYGGIMLGRIKYYNGWNIYYTFLSYAVAFVIAAVYYYAVRNLFFRVAREINIDYPGKK